MKLQAEYEHAKTIALEKVNDEILYNHTYSIIQCGQYKNLEVRIAHDLKNVTMPVKTVCSWYDKYDCNDNHITTLYKRILKNNYPKTWILIQSK